MRNDSVSTIIWSCGSCGTSCLFWAFRYSKKCFWTIWAIDYCTVRVFPLIIKPNIPIIIEFATNLTKKWHNGHIIICVATVNSICIIPILFWTSDKPKRWKWSITANNFYWSSGVFTTIRWWRKRILPWCTRVTIIQIIVMWNTILQIKSFFIHFFCKCVISIVKRQSL